MSEKKRKKGRIALCIVCAFVLALGIFLIVWYCGASYPQFDPLARQEFAIPGLSDGVCPQGLTALPENKQGYDFAMSGYLSSGPSRIYLIDEEDAGDVKYITVSENGAADEEAMRANFDARMQKDKRYKNEGQIQEGLQDEYKRLLSLRDAYADVQSWLQDGTLSLASVDVEVQAEDGSEETTTEKWTYAFNLSNVPNITYVLRNSEREGSAEGLCMSIINTGSSGEEDRRYEPFTFLAYIVDLCAAQAAA